MNVVFKPVGILSGVLAGVIGKKIFTLAWGVIDDQEPPQPKHRQVQLGKLAAALVLEGAIFGVVRGLTDHGARHGFRALTGEWPGAETPEAEDD